MGARLLPPPPLQLHRIRDQREIWFGRFHGLRRVRPRELWAPKDLERREHSRTRLDFFAETYFPHLYYDPDPYHVETLRREAGYLMVDETVVMHQAEAGPRSLGKTTLRIILDIWAKCHQWSQMSLWVRKKLSGDEGAESRIRQIKNEFLTNELLAEDFPELCMWVRGFKGNPKSCPPPYIWSDHRIKMPGPRYSLAGGVEGSLTGLIVDGVRPDLIILDDLETRQSAESKKEQKSLHDAFDADFIRLHDVNRRAVYIQLGNIRTKESLIARNCDRARMPAWRGRIYKAILKEPERVDLWENYVAIYKGEMEPPEYVASVSDGQISDALGMSVGAIAKKVEDAETIRWAYAYYAANKEVMDAGGEVLSPRRLPLWKCYECWAAEGKSTFHTELQNEPPKDSGETLDLQLNVPFLAQQKSDLKEGVVPDWAEFLTVAVDVGLYELHWAVDAWRLKDKDSHVVAHGVLETGLRRQRMKQLREEADEKRYRDIVFAALRLAFQRVFDAVMAGRTPEQLDALGRARPAVTLSRVDGEPLRPAVCVIDCGGTAGGLQAPTPAWYSCVLQFCDRAGPSWFPMKGARWTGKQFEKSEGRNWLIEAKNNPCRRVDANHSYYKLQMVQAFESKSRGLHADVDRTYLRQLCGEKYHGTFTPGKPTERAEQAVWERVGANHWFDAGWMAHAAADVARFIVGRRRKRPRPASPRKDKIRREY